MAYSCFYFLCLWKCWCLGVPGFKPSVNDIFPNQDSMQLGVPVGGCVPLCPLSDRCSGYEGFCQCILGDLLQCIWSKLSTDYECLHGGWVPILDASHDHMLFCIRGSHLFSGIQVLGPCLDQGRDEVWRHVGLELSSRLWGNRCHLGNTFNYTIHHVADDWEKTEWTIIGFV